MTYFFDANWSPKFVHAFKALGRDVTHLHDQFKPNTPDEEWIPIVGENGYALISMDVRIMRNPQQRRVLADAKIISFFAAAGVARLDFWKQFQWLTNTWPEIERNARCAAPATFQISMNHKVHLYGLPKK